MRDRVSVQSLAAVVGVVFVVVGVLGFVPGITTHYGSMSFAGHGSSAKLFGIFQVSILHNLFHLVFGLVGLALAKTAEGASSFLVGGGVVYLALWVLGVIGAQAIFAAGEHRRQLAALSARDRDARARVRRGSWPGPHGRVHLASGCGTGAPCLCAWSISARISSAISGAVSPPRSRPTGPRMPSVSSPSFSRRFSCARREPSAPT